MLLIDVLFPSSESANILTHVDIIVPICPPLPLNCEAILTPGGNMATLSDGDGCHGNRTAFRQFIKTKTFSWLIWQILGFVVIIFCLQTSLQMAVLTLSALSIKIDIYINKAPLVSNQ